MNRTAEFVLGLIGGITGIIAAGTTMLAGLFMTAASVATMEDFGSLFGFGAIAFGVLIFLMSGFAIVASCLIKANAKLWGIILIIIGGVGFVLIQLLWIVPGVLLLISGIMCVSRKPPYEDF
ncbi:hypothetical protein PWEIH_11590 [Listeria weihenstephanensis FSL R9-0317]|uniref:DUF4064 domain-containing protein n=1 Tax=Listeria weihenstephanensis TaxID=1006155 RepID=A0A1S7FUY3_9LIST|nr:DUF4064 domain-containing protein [Listeria weihenstephanensis]AQY51264.1 hypothetical protein UE46_09495 [Listeria weihenstephanensis]EUJ36797.1 hypothetical protein PWEIH_11590 [Listeria weihenstephanensis FSL R9-0317]MBC1500310.1 DUF4064 domain-containing protein [Listeria weihenstephanensis]